MRGWSAPTWALACRRVPPMFLPALVFCTGALALLLLPALPPAGALPALIIVACACRRRHPLLAAGACGLALATASVGARLARDWPCARDGETVALEGTVATPAILRHGRVDFDFDAAMPDRFRARLSWYEAEAVPQPGDRWRFAARLRCRRGLANPGALDRELDLLRQGVSATGYLLATPAPARLANAAGERRLQGLRARVADGIASALPPGPTAAVLQGLAVGQRGNLPDALWDAFAATGVAHLMAISGMHVTACALVALWLLRRLRRLPGLRAQRHWIALETGVVLTATAGYTALAGASAPSLRTLAMVVVCVLLRLLRRRPGPHETLAFAGLALIAADPLAASSAGFWLSFVATAALFAVLHDGAGFAGRLMSFTRAQAAIGAALAPVLIASFGRVSLVAPLANAIAIPFFSFLLLPVVLFATLLEVLAAGAGQAAWRLLGKLLDPLWPWMVLAGNWPWAAWSPAAQPGWLLAAAGAAGFCGLLLPLHGLRAAAAALAIAIATGATPESGRAAWTLTVLDVGQGLAAVVATRSRVLVFDTGPRWRGGGAAAEVSLLPYLRARGIRRIDRLVVSHADQDHGGGAQALAAALPIARRADCRFGEQWRWDGVLFRVLHPPPDMQGGDNDRSCALHVSGAGGSALLLADPEARAEARLAALLLAADVVLLPHHGSRSSSSPALVAAVGASLGVASAAAGNRWGMPDPAIVARWRAAGTTVLATASAGAITIRFGGESPAPVVATARSRRRWWQPATAPRRPRAGGGRARYHAAPCGKSSSPAGRSCGRSCCARSSPPRSSSSVCGRCNASA
ncbi:MAG: DNA internalization-related competence protein ComEC/Rec2 [Gammaproteobacteria bacterium]